MRRGEDNLGGSLSIPTFDRATAREFLCAVYADRAAALVVGFTEGVYVAPDSPNETERFEQILNRAEQERQHLFFHVSTLQQVWRDPGGHAKGRVTVANKNILPDGSWQHVRKCPYLWLDCDAEKYEGADPGEAARHYESEGVRVSAQIDTKLNAINITPFAKWRSGAGWQCLIKLDQSIPPAEAEVLVEKLHTYLGFDPCVKNPNRILRVAGSINWKDKKDGRVPASCTPLRLLPKAIMAVQDIREALGRVDSSVGNGVGSDRGDGAVHPSGVATDKADLITVDWSKVNKLNPWLSSVEDLPEGAHAKLRIIVETKDIDIDDLRYRVIIAGQQREGERKPFKGGWSDVSQSMAAYLKMTKDWTPEWLAEALWADLPCNQHFKKHKNNDGNRQRAIERAINHAFEQPRNKLVREVQEATRIVWEPQDTDPKTGFPKPTLANAIRALDNMGITARHDLFHDRTEVISGDRWATITDGLLSDATVGAVRVHMMHRFKLDFGALTVRDALVDGIARQNCYDPVLDMLEDAEANWDGVKRLGTFAVDYLNCEDDINGLNRAIGKLLILAAVRRARRPGCKCDYIFTLLSEEGWNKSSFFAAMAGQENFSDQRIFGTDDKTAQEQLCGVWWHENSELQGMSKADVDAVTAFASRTEDRARPAYGRVLERKPRRSIEVASTNNRNFLKKQTGNRRWLILEPLKRLDMERILRDRLQIIGEAAVLEREDPTDKLAMLPESLWSTAAKMQETYLEDDPWDDVLAHMPKWITNPENPHDEPHTILHSDENGKEIVASRDILSHVLRIPTDRQTKKMAMDLSDTMRRLGWKRAKNGNVSMGGATVKGYWRGGNLLSVVKQEKVI